jgi:hypothetical protein
MGGETMKGIAGLGVTLRYKDYTASGFAVANKSFNASCGNSCLSLDRYTTLTQR